MTSFPPPPGPSVHPNGPAGEPGEHSQPTSSSGSEPQWEPGAFTAGGPAPGTDLAADLGAGLKFAGQAMLRNPMAFLASGLIYPVLIFGVAFGGMAAAIGLIGARVDQWAISDGAAVGLILLSIGLSFVALLLGYLLSVPWQSGAARAGEIIVEGGRPTVGQTFLGPARVLVTALVTLVIVMIGTFLLQIPGLIASVLLFYAIPAAVRGSSPGEALRVSFQLAKNNLGTTIVAWLILAVSASLAGAIVVGVIIVVPFTVLFQLGMFERLIGRALPEPARS